MAKPARSPLLGYNHNVRYEGRIFHVQTEDSGPGNPHLFTHLYFQGSILASKRSQYDPDTFEDEVRSGMQGQHKAILRELKQGAFDERIARFFELRGETFKTDEPAALDGTLDQAAVVGAAPDATAPAGVPVESAEAAPLGGTPLESSPLEAATRAYGAAAPVEAPLQAEAAAAPTEGMRESFADPAEVSHVGVAEQLPAVATVNRNPPVTYLDDPL